VIDTVRHGAGALATAIRTRDLSSRDVLEAHLARVAEVNPQVGASTEAITPIDPRGT
jgi:Asp-tRNA(Asn)/Glu-tRNA(Gln) amidotransferase A subunit family amidase